MKEFVGYCDQEQIELMFLRFYKGDKAPEHARTFARKYVIFLLYLIIFLDRIIIKMFYFLLLRVLEQKKVVSPAQIQGYFMFHKHSPPDDVLLDVQTIWTL